MNSRRRPCSTTIASFIYSISFVSSGGSNGSSIEHQQSYFTGNSQEDERSTLLIPHTCIAVHSSAVHRFVSLHGCNTI